MHLLYVDESGSVGDPQQQYFVLAGVAVFERRTHWIEQELNTIAAEFDSNEPHSVELHGSPMRGGRTGFRRQFPLPQRIEAIKRSLDRGVASQPHGEVRVFASVIRKAAVPGTDAVHLAFEELCRRFDLFLMRLHFKHSQSQRGIMLFDKSSTEMRIQTLAREFKYNGHATGKTKNYAEVPVFLDSRASRLIQLADLVSYAVFRHYECGDSTFFELIRDRFDREGDVLHGLFIKQ